MESSSSQIEELKSSAENTYIWQYQANKDPWNPRQRPFWRSYPQKINNQIEQAFRENITMHNIGEYTLYFEPLI